MVDDKPEDEKHNSLGRHHVPAHVDVCDPTGWVRMTRSPWWSMLFPHNHALPGRARGKDGRATILLWALVMVEERGLDGVGRVGECG